MRLTVKHAPTVLLAMSLAACGGADNAEDTSVTATAAAPAATPYKPVATVLDLMRGTITLAAEEYWESVSIVVDADGVHENMPQDDLEWFEVWSAGITLAESGNLLMMPPRAVDEGEWIRLSTALVDAGVEAARVAAAQDFEGVLEMGETVYNACVECHRIYVPALPDI